jgi:hypothetical protein
MKTVIINPGTGPVANASEDNAIENIKQFAKDCEEQSGCVGITWERTPEADDGGRFGFIVKREDVTHEIEMPGLPLEKVRYLNDSQTIWHFPRLYVDGSSWVWKYAVLKRKEDWMRDAEGVVES